MSRWDIPAGSTAPPDFLIGRVSPAGNRYHLSAVEVYSNSLCGRGIPATTDTVGPSASLCPDCAKEAGIERGSDLPLDAEAAAWWAVHTKANS